MTRVNENLWMNALFGDPEVAELFTAEASLQHMLNIEVAWTRAIAPVDVAARIEASIMSLSVTPRDLVQGVARDGVPVPALVRHIKRGIPEMHHQWVHRGLTSQDVIDTSLMLALKQLFPILMTRLDDLIGALELLSKRDGAHEIMAVTRMQPALPISVGDRIATWRRPLESLRGQLPTLAERCRVFQLGGPVGTRGGCIADKAVANFASTLELRDPGHAFHSDRSLLAEVAEFLSRVTGVIGKIGLDVGHMALNAQDTITLAGTGGSSAMPHKQNPVRAEVLVALARRNSGDLSQMHLALGHEFERSGAAWMLEWITLPTMAETCGCSLLTAQKLIKQIEHIGAPAA